MGIQHKVITPSLDGFEDVKRYWDNENGIVAAKILPGEYYVTKSNEMITTVLGSCISACIRDKVVGIGGMNHFMLPETTQDRLEQGSESVVGTATRYGNYAMEHLINGILSNGGKRDNLEVKLFGGGKIIATLGDVGLKNIRFVLDYIKMEGFVITSKDLGDIYPRKVNFYPRTGQVKMKKLKTLHNETIITRETQYRNSIQDTEVESEIELF